MNKWKVELANEETGERKTVEYRVAWNPEKVSPLSVVHSCAAEYTVERRQKHLGLGAELMGRVA